jgi:hypothetical protein
LGFGRNFLPVEAFSYHHSHCGFFDSKETEILQNILRFQNHSLQDFYEEVREWIGFKRKFFPLVKILVRWYLLKKSDFYKIQKKL